MERLDFQALQQILKARTVREKAVLLGACIAVLVWFWLLLVRDAMVQEQNTVEQQLLGIEKQIAAQHARYRELTDPSAVDPVAEARDRKAVLQKQIELLDSHVDELGSHLIPPRQMAVVLTRILRSETSLQLLSLENLPPRPLFKSGSGAVPAEPEAASVPAVAPLQVYQHGLTMVFEGSYLETIRYLQSLETLDNKFFWEDLDFTLAEYPNGKITLNIYTLSKQKEWIGV